MRLNICISRSVLVLTIFLLLSASATSTTAQTITGPATSTPAGQVKAEGVTPLAKSNWTRLKIGKKDRSQLAAANDRAWQILLSKDCSDRQSEACAAEAVMLANSTCAASSLLFQRVSSGWQKAQFILMIAAAGFTGVGAAATIDGSMTVPKVFSTLGGTSGIGASYATINSYEQGSAAGITAVNAIQAEILKLQTPATSDDPGNATIFQQAEGYSYQCVAANPSGTTGNTTTPGNNGGGSPAPKPAPGGGAGGGGAPAPKPSGDTQ
jgi:hypothetical protein